MAWQLRDAVLRAAIDELVDALNGRCALAGTVGAQLHLAACLGLDKRGPPAHGIDVIVLGDSFGAQSACLMGGSLEPSASHADGAVLLLRGIVAIRDGFAR